MANSCMSARDEDVLDLIFNPMGLPQFQAMSEQNDLGPLSEFSEEQRQVYIN